MAYRGRSGGTFVAADPPLAAEGDGEPLGEEAWAVLDARVAAEAGGCILACERAGPHDLERLEALVDRMAAAPDFAEYRRADMRFHIGVAEAARSPRLVTAMTELQGQMSDLLARIPHPEHVLTRSNSQHRRLLMLIERRDAPRTVRLMRDHIEGTEHILAGLLPPVGPLAPRAYRAEARQDRTPGRVTKARRFAVRAAIWRLGVADAYPSCQRGADSRAGWPTNAALARR